MFNNERIKSNKRKIRLFRKVNKYNYILNKFFKKYLKIFVKKLLKTDLKKKSYNTIMPESEILNYSLEKNKNINNIMESNTRKKRIKLINVERNYNRLESKK